MRILLSLLLWIGLSSITLAQAERYVGSMDDTTADAEYSVYLEAGQTLNALTIATSGNLDTVLGLRDAEGILLLQNDDRDATTLNSFITYTAITARRLYHHCLQYSGNKRRLCAEHRNQ